MRLLVDLAKVAVAWPVYATYQAFALANACQGSPAKAVKFSSFLPVIVVTTLIWAMSWALTFWLLMRSV